METEASEPIDPTSFPDNRGDDGGDSSSGFGEDETSAGSETGDPVPKGPEKEDEDESQSGALFFIDDAEGPSEIVMLARAADGTLSELGSYPSGGDGSGGDLGSQGAIALAGDRLFSVNPGDDTIAVMRVFEDHLSLMDVEPSGGVRPTSLTVTGDRLYVLNAAGEGSLTGFTIEDDGLVPIEGASAPLSGGKMPAPAQVAASPDGSTLVVTERATNQILTYEIGGDGSLAGPVINSAEGMTPFGLDFRDDGIFVVSEAFGGEMNPGASTLSSQRISDGGTLWAFSSTVPNGQTASCWVEIVRGAFVYTTNTYSDSISAYAMDDMGALTLFPAGGVVVDFGDGHGPVDMTTSADERFLYVLNAHSDSIVGFEVDDLGQLSEVTTIEIPEAGIGLAGR